ncbi:MAG: hypothetical protein ACI4VC_05040 [Clostridia bacterium]
MSNKSVKEQMIQIYGAECFIEKLRLRQDKNRKYKGKGQLNKMKQLTYHHIKMKKDGGKATVENGALLSAENHAWFHQQSPEKQAEMNKAFQEYKMSVAEVTTHGIIQAHKIDIDMNDCMTIPLENNRETTKQRRAREKRELRREMEEIEL